jgi:hypothetical protein
VFRTTVHGTVFGDRAARVAALRAGETVLLVPDPPMEEDPAVWVHAADGTPIGHLPPEVNAWLAMYLLHRGRATANVVKVGGDDVPSWRRLLVEVRCEVADQAANSDG